MTQHLEAIHQQIAELEAQVAELEAQIAALKIRAHAAGLPTTDSSTNQGTVGMHQSQAFGITAGTMVQSTVTQVFARPSLMAEIGTWWKAGYVLGTTLVSWVIRDITTEESWRRTWVGHLAVWCVYWSICVGVVVGPDGWAVPRSIAIPPPRTIIFDPAAHYAMRIYNCDDICQIYVNEQEAPLIEVLYGQESGWVDITRALAGETTRLTFRVINTDKQVTYGVQIRKNTDMDMIEHRQCGVATHFGCDDNRDYPNGAVVEFSYLFVRS